MTDTDHIDHINHIAGDTERRTGRHTAGRIR
jgi:hypothetical protein